MQNYLKMSKAERLLYGPKIGDRAKYKNLMRGVIYGAVDYDLYHTLNFVVKRFVDET